MTAWSACTAGARRVARAPAILALVWCATLVFSIPLSLGVRHDIEQQLGSSLEAQRQRDSVTYDWMSEFGARATGASSTFGPSVLGFAAVLDNVDAFLDQESQPIVIGAFGIGYLLLWTWLAGGIIDRYARGHATRTHGFFQASGGYFVRLLRLSLISAVFYWLLLGRFHGWLAELYDRSTADLGTERTAFFIQLALYATFLAAVGLVNLWFDYAKIRLVAENRGSVIGALRAAARLIRRSPGRVIALYLIDTMLFGLVLAAYAAVAPDGTSTWLAFVVGQVFVASRLTVKLLFWASETALFQGRPALAGHAAARALVRPDSADAEPLESGYTPLSARPPSETSHMSRTRYVFTLLAISIVTATAAFTTLVAQQPAFRRTMLHQHDLSVAGHEVVMAKAEFPKGTSTGKHTHPGEESSYVSMGTMSIVIDGVAKTYKMGESFFIPAGKVHDALNIDAGESAVIANYIVEKGKPLTTPVK